MRSCIANICDQTWNDRADIHECARRWRYSRRLTKRDRCPERAGNGQLRQSHSMALQRELRMKYTQHKFEKLNLLEHYRMETG
jgi:hypothetical protein